MKQIEVTHQHWEWLGAALCRHAHAKSAPSVIKLIFAWIGLVEYDKGAVIITEGDRGDEMYAIYQGSVAVRRGDKAIATLGPGDLFGEVSLVAHVPRTATVSATGTCQVFRISRRALNAIVEHFPELMVAISRLARERVVLP